jgi:hypothetical protein
MRSFRDRGAPYGERDVHLPQGASANRADAPARDCVAPPSVWLREQMRNHVRNPAAIDSPGNILNFPHGAPRSARYDATRVFSHTRKRRSRASCSGRPGLFGHQKQPVVSFPAGRAKYLLRSIKPRGEKRWIGRDEYAHIVLVCRPRECGRSAAGQPFGLRNRSQMSLGPFMTRSTVTMIAPLTFGRIDVENRHRQARHARKACQNETLEVIAVLCRKLSVRFHAIIDDAPSP